jgi:hypothetical protein
MKLPLFLSAGVVLLATSLPCQVLAAQEASSQQPATQADPAAPSAMNQSADSQTFTGTIVKANGRFVLRDAASKTDYVLDDQDKAKLLAGKSVKVTGKLDKQTNTLHTTAIEPES